MADHKEKLNDYKRVYICSLIGTRKQKRTRANTEARGNLNLTVNLDISDDKKVGERHFI